MLIILLFVVSMSASRAEIVNIDIIERLLIESDNSNEEIKRMLDIIDFYSSNKIPVLEANLREIAILPSINMNDGKKMKEYLLEHRDANLVKMCRELKFSILQSEIIYNCISPSYGSIKNYYSKNFVDLRSVSDFPFDESKGCSTGKYYRSNYGQNIKLRASFADYKLGFLSDKDVGEKSWTDVYCFYLYKNFDQHSITVGNFKVNSGLGLILGDAFAGSKYSNIAYADADISNEISPFLSAYSSTAFRGIAYQGNFPLYGRYKITTSVFASNALKSATLNKDSCISSIYSSCYFRTENELSKKNNVDEKTFGGNIGLTSDKFSFIYSAYTSSFDRETAPSGNNLFRGDNTLMQSLSCASSIGNFSLAAEIAAVKSSAAFQLNTKYVMNDDEIRLLYRNYSSGFTSFYGINSFENTYVNNENGVAAAWIHKFGSRFSCEVVADVFTLPDSTSSASQRRNGADLEARLFYVFNSKNKLGLRLRYVGKDKEKGGNMDLNRLYRFRCDWDHVVSTKLSFRLRGDFAYLQENSNYATSVGAMLLLGLKYKAAKKLSINSNICIYNTDDFNSAIWIVSNLAASSMHIKSMYLKGTYGELALDYNILKNFKIAAMYEINYKPDEKNLKSGLDQLPKNHEQKVSIVLKLKVE